MLIDGFFETEPISAVSFIAHYLPLLDLPTWLRDVVDSGKLAKGKALLIERTEFPEKVKRKLAKEYITKSENEVKRHIESLKADPTLQDKNEQEIVKTEHSSEELKDESCVIRVDESADADEETETMYKCPHCDHIQPRRMKEKCEKCGREHRPDHKDLVKMPKRR